MARIITYLDAGVLIQAITGRNKIQQRRAMDILHDSNRDFASSILVQLAGAIYFSTSNRDGCSDPTKEDDRILRIVKR